MKRSSTIFLQVVIVLIGIGALALMLWEPHIEGRNSHATLFQIYFNAIPGVCVSSVHFIFFALYQAFKLLGYIGQDNNRLISSCRTSISSCLCRISAEPSQSRLRVCIVTSGVSCHPVPGRAFRHGPGLLESASRLKCFQTITVGVAVDLWESVGHARRGSVKSGGRTRCLFRFL